MRGRTLALTFVVCLGLAQGCLTTPKDNADTPPAQGRGMGSSTPGTASQEDEEWSKIGRQMRGDAPVQQTWDPLRDLMVSPKAQSIERSLGVDD